VTVFSRCSARWRAECWDSIISVLRPLKGGSWDTIISVLCPLKGGSWDSIRDSIISVLRPLKGYLGALPVEGRSVETVLSRCSAHWRAILVLCPLKGGVLRQYYLGAPPIEGKELRQYYLGALPVEGRNFETAWGTVLSRCSTHWREGCWNIIILVLRPLKGGVRRVTQ